MDPLKHSPLVIFSAHPFIIFYSYFSFFEFMIFFDYSFFFFFSSRRRHTRYIGDWSSDVCSSDLEALLRKPGFAWAYLMLADVHARRGEYGMQLHDLDAYLKLEPDGPASRPVREIDRKSVV